MKKLFVTIGTLLAMQLQAQVYRNCTVLLNAIHKDSSLISAQSKEAWMELDLKSNEVTLIVTLGTFKSTDSIQKHEFDAPNEKFYFRGRFDGNAYNLLNEIVNDDIQNLSGTVRMNGEEMNVVSKYSIFKGSNSTADTDVQRNLLFSLIIPLKLSDYNLTSDFPELTDNMTLHLVRQPVNIVSEPTKIK